MSTTSTATALVAHNHIPGNEVELLNHVCVLVLIRGDDTLFHAASIQDIVEICIWLEQTHPKSVLWYSAVEWVILFQSTEEMWVAVHGVIKAMASCKEPIWLRMSPPSATHVRAFMATRNGELSDTQPPTPNRGKNLHHPLMTPTWMGGPHINFRQTLGILVMLCYGSSWRTSAWR